MYSLLRKIWARRSLLPYLGLAVGVSLAIHWSNEAQNDAKSKGASVRAVLCEQLTEDDLELYKYVHDHPRGHGGLAELITPDLVAKSVQKNAERRYKIGFAPTPGSCHSNITINPYLLVKDKPKS